MPPLSTRTPLQYALHTLRYKSFQLTLRWCEGVDTDTLLVDERVQSAVLKNCLSLIYVHTLRPAQL